MPQRRRLRNKLRKHGSHINYIKKVLNSTTKKLFFGIRDANEIATGNGKLSLVQDLVTGSEYPLHIFPLNNIINDGNSQSGGYKLDSNGYDFTSLLNVENYGADGQTHIDHTAANNLGKNILYNNYNEIRLLLWGRAARKSVFRVSIISLRDDELDPNLSPTTTNTDTQEKRQIFFLYHLLKPMITNPVVNDSSGIKQLHGAGKVLWSKTYKVRETLSTEDEAQHKFVKIFRKRNKLLRFQESPSTAAQLTADGVGIIGNNETPSNYPAHSKDNLFLVVTGNSTTEDDALTYDISVKSKYTLLGNV